MGVNKSWSKSLVAIKTPLFVALLIGLVVFFINAWTVHAVEPLTTSTTTITTTSTTTTTIPECYTDEDCGECPGYDKDDCGYDGDYNTLDHLVSGTKTCVDGQCTTDECEYVNYCADDDLYDIITAACEAECDEDLDCPDYCSDDTLYMGSCDLDGDCTCDYDPYDCNDDDGWYDTGETRWVDDPSDQCKEKEQKEQEYRDYGCYENEIAECDYTVTDTQWVDTTETINKEDGTPCDDGEWCTDPDTCQSGECTGPEIDCSDEDECTIDTCDEENDRCVHTHEDDEPPVTTKTYGTPRYPDDENNAEWITSLTPVTLTAVDQGPGECKVGVHEIWYKDIYLPDEEDWHYCDEDCGEWEPNDPEDEGWVLYWSQENGGTGPFYKEPDSCHIIEYYSVDKLGNPEDVNWQCVFVDNTPPVIEKTVGDPKAECEESEDWDWKITISTPITLDCEDLGDHPVDEVEMYYRIFLDGELVQDWTYYEGETIYFDETCLHKLEVYCIDVLGNIAWDNETFKVVDKEFNITLNKKWNLISVPFILLDDDIEDVLENVEENVEIVWTYDAEADEWYVYTPDGEDNDNLEEMLPGWGYWIKMSESDLLMLGGESWGMPPSPPSPQRNLVDGWNLAGYYGSDGLESYNGPFGNGNYAACALNSLLDGDNNPQWSKILTYWEPYNPYQWVDASSMCDRLDPGAGYWLFIKSEQLYGPGECPEPLCL